MQQVKNLEGHRRLLGIVAIWWAIYHLVLGYWSIITTSLSISIVSQILPHL